MTRTFILTDSKNRKGLIPNVEFLVKMLKGGKATFPDPVIISTANGPQITLNHELLELDADLLINTINKMLDSWDKHNES